MPVFLRDARQSTVGVGFSIETHELIDKVLVGINYIVPTGLEKNMSLGSTRKTELNFYKNVSDLR